MPEGTLSRSAIFDLPPELSGGLTFHLPMEIQALDSAGAPSDVIARRVRSQLREAYASGLVDPPLYRWAVDRYQETAHRLLSNDSSDREAAFHAVAPLGDGLAGAAFHGLIRLGYGAWNRDAAEIARGLAYMRTRRQVLASWTGTAEGIGETDLPSPADSEGATVFDLLNIAAGTGAPALQAATDSASRRTLRSIVAEAAGLVTRNPSSFVSVHALTGFHALCEVHNLLSGSGPTDESVHFPLLAPWWNSFAIATHACALIVRSHPPEALPAYDPQSQRIETLDDLVRDSLRSDDTHDLKLCVALRRLVEFGLLSKDEALAVGMQRLASGQASKNA